VRVGLVGCGFIGNVHSRALWALRKTGVADVSVAAVCDADPERAAMLAKPHDAEIRPLDALLDDVDVVYVCTPTAEHRTVVAAAAERGKAIFCEKPLAPNLEQAREVAELLATVPHQVGLVLRAAPVFEEIHRRIRDGSHGRAMAVSLRDDQFFPIQGHYASTWRSDRDIAGGGTLIEHSIHDIDVLRWLLGDPSTAICRTSSFFGHPGIEDLATASFSYASGATSSLLSVWHQVLTRPSTRRLEVFCEEGVMWTDDDNTGPLHVRTSTASDVVECPLPGWTEAIPVPAGTRASLGLYAEASRRFLSAVESKATGGSPSSDDAFAAHRLVDACYASAERGGEPITLYVPTSESSRG
jgi:predicted dehydrogenase